MNLAEPTASKRGRPRDDTIEDRVREAAAAIYASEGWRGFSFERVARAARVGKGTIYLRWDSREALLVDVLGQYDVPFVDLDSGNLRDDLLVLAFTYGRWLQGNQHPVMLRMIIDRRTNDEFRTKVVSQIAWTSVSAAHQITHRAKQRGELPQDASSAVILDAVLGGVMQHLTTAEEWGGGGLYDSAPGQRFVVRLVDYVLAGFVQDQAGTEKRRRTVSAAPARPEAEPATPRPRRSPHNPPAKPRARSRSAGS